MNSANSELSCNSDKRKRDEGSDEDRKDDNEKKCKLQEEEVSLTINVTGEFLSDEVEKEENHFVTLIDDALKIIETKINVTDQEVKNAIKSVFYPAFSNYDLHRVDLSKPEILVAYFHGYCNGESMSLARNRFQDAFKKCQQLQDAIKIPHLKIISLGGGPGTDITSFCSVLQDFADDSLCRLDLTVVDMSKRWEPIYNVIRFLLLAGSYGNASTLNQNKNVVSSFIHQDIRMSRSERVEQYNRDIRNADIVLLARVLNSYKFDEVSPQGILQGIISDMKKGAFLFVIDAVITEHASDEATLIYKSQSPEYSSPSKQTKRFDFNPSSGSKCQLFVLTKK